MKTIEHQKAARVRMVATIVLMVSIVLASRIPDLATLFIWAILFGALFFVITKMKWIADFSNKLQCRVERVIVFLAVFLFVVAFILQSIK